MGIRDRGRHLALQCLNLWLLRVFRGYQRTRSGLAPFKKNRSVCDIGHKSLSGERANLSDKDGHKTNP
jgi:hypothetical protein